MSSTLLLESKEIKDAIEKLGNVSPTPLVIEAFWDGDSYGWRVHIVAIIESSTQGKHKYEQQFLQMFPCTPSDWDSPKYKGLPSVGGSKALELVNLLASKIGVPAYFSSDDEPRDECARWWEKDKGVPCDRCGRLLVQSEKNLCPWRGICYPCFLEKEHAKKLNSDSHST